MITTCLVSPYAHVNPRHRNKLILAAAATAGAGVALQMIDNKCECTIL